MKSLIQTLVLVASLSSFCLAKPVAQSHSGLFAVHQKYLGASSETGMGLWSESIVFNDPKLLTLALPGFPWPGVYSISPDDRWVFRIRKTGSGDNEAILYQIKNGRALEALNFDGLLWTAADKTSKLKKRQLYHTGIRESKWSENGKKLTLVLGGTNTDSRDKIRSVRHSLTYDLGSNLIISNKVEYHARSSSPARSK